MTQKPETPDVITLRARAAHLMATGVLPSSAPARSWGGPGSGEPCALCDATIAPGQLEFELEFPAGDGDGGAPLAATCRFHAQCFDAWLQARRDGGPS